MRYSTKKYLLTLNFFLFCIVVSGQLSWSGDSPVYTTGSINHTYTNVSALTPNRTVGISMTYNEPSPLASWGSSTPTVPSGSPSRLSISPNFSGNTTANNLEVNITFSLPACDVNFNIDDIDLSGTGPTFDFVDQVTITAMESGGGTINPTSISAAGTNSVAGNVITGTSSGSSQNTVSFSGKCITSIRLVFTNGPNVKSNPNGQNFALLDINSNENSGDPFPVDFISFTGSQLNSSIELNWTTVNEINNQGFEIQRSRNAVSFETIGLIEGLNQDSYYSFIDTNPLDGINYFRLKQKDFDGNFKFSKIIDIYFNQSGAFSIYPNPASSKEPISIVGINNESLLSIVNQKGQLLNTSLIDGKVNLPSGVYFFKLSNPLKIENKKLVVY